jgi:hypothetical protein
VPVAFVGVVTGDGHIKLVDRKTNTTPVDLPLELVLGKMPKKVPSAAPLLPPAQHRLRIITKGCDNRSAEGHG